MVTVKIRVKEEHLIRSMSAGIMDELPLDVNTEEDLVLGTLNKHFNVQFFGPEEYEVQPFEGNILVYPREDTPSG